MVSHSTLDHISVYFMTPLEKDSSEEKSKIFYKIFKKYLYFNILLFLFFKRQNNEIFKSSSFTRSSVPERPTWGQKILFLLHLYLRMHNVSYVKQHSGKRSKARTSSTNFKTFFSIWFAVKIPESKHVLLGFRHCSCVADNRTTDNSMDHVTPSC